MVELVFGDCDARHSSDGCHYPGLLEYQWSAKDLFEPPPHTAKRIGRLLEMKATLRLPQ